jgi:hypothetical protein
MKSAITILIASTIGFSAANGQLATNAQQRHDQHMTRVAGFAAHKIEHDKKIAAERAAAPAKQQAKQQRIAAFNAREVSRRQRNTTKAMRP